MKQNTIVVMTMTISVCLFGCNKKEAKEAEDQTTVKVEEIRKEIVKETGEAGAKAKELQEKARKKTDEITAEAAPEVQALKDATARKLDEARAAIHEATAPSTPSPTPESTK